MQETAPSSEGRINPAQRAPQKNDAYHLLLVVSNLRRRAPLYSRHVENVRVSQIGFSVFAPARYNELTRLTLEDSGVAPSC